MIIIIPWISFLALLNVSGIFGSEYGYDSASACGRELRQQRARELPCDFSKENWCDVPGKSYPWQAVRRFVKENHGLMRRMYGDYGHYSVLSTEFHQNNDDITRLHFTESFRHFRGDNKRVNSPKSNPKSFYSDVIDANIYLADDENEFDLDDEDFEPRYPRNRRGRYLRQDDVLLNTKFTFADAEFRPNDLFAHLRQSTTLKPVRTPLIKFPDALDSQKHVGPDPVVQEMLSNDLDSNGGIFNINNYTIIILESANVTAPINQTGGLNNVTSTEESVVTTSTENTTVSEEITTEYITTVEDITSTENLEENTTTKLNPDEIHVSSTSIDYQEDTKQAQPNLQSGNSADDMETSQLFQDTVADQEFSDSEPAPVKLKGVNACPVKEEVVAPFWANNTRGEVLALLNLYPFEQYVHWEKCSFEHRQMYCREGCRCEQQYRLHRLLAYDPSNECRGIFSDWFRFPSCCVCKCYDLPTEFRVTSRSPRDRAIPAQKPQRQAKIDPEWYRPSTASQTLNNDDGSIL